MGDMMARPGGRQCLCLVGRGLGKGAPTMQKPLHGPLIRRVFYEISLSRFLHHPTSCRRIVVGARWINQSTAPCLSSPQLRFHHDFKEAIDDEEPQDACLMMEEEHFGPMAAKRENRYRGIIIQEDQSNQGDQLRRHFRCSWPAGIKSQVCQSNEYSG